MVKNIIKRNIALEQYEILLAMAAPFILYSFMRKYAEGTINTKPIKELMVLI